MNTFSYLWHYFAEFLLEWEMFQMKIVEKIKLHILCSVAFSPKIVPFYEIMSKNVWWSQRGRRWQHCGALHARLLRLLAGKHKHTHTHTEICKTLLFHGNNRFVNVACTLPLFVSSRTVLGPIYGAQTLGVPSFWITKACPYLGYWTKCYSPPRTSC